MQKKSDNCPFNVSALYNREHPVVWRIWYLSYLKMLSMAMAVSMMTKVMAQQTCNEIDHKHQGGVCVYERVVSFHLFFCCIFFPLGFNSHQYSGLGGELSRSPRSC